MLLLRALSEMGGAARDGTASVVGEVGCVVAVVHGNFGAAPVGGGCAPKPNASLEEAPFEATRFVSRLITLTSTFAPVRSAIADSLARTSGLMGDVAAERSGWAGWRGVGAAAEE